MKKVTKLVRKKFYIIESNLNPDELIVVDDKKQAEHLAENGDTIYLAEVKDCFHSFSEWKRVK